MNKTAEWVLRIAVAGEFLGHGIFAAATGFSKPSFPSLRRKERKTPFPSLDRPIPLKVSYFVLFMHYQVGIQISPMEPERQVSGVVQNGERSSI